MLAAGPGRHGRRAGDPDGTETRSDALTRRRPGIRATASERRYSVAEAVRPGSSISRALASSAFLTGSTSNLGVDRLTVHRPALGSRLPAPGQSPRGLAKIGGGAQTGAQTS